MYLISPNQANLEGAKQKRITIYAWSQQGRRLRGGWVGGVTPQPPAQAVGKIWLPRQIDVRGKFKREKEKQTPFWLP